MSDLISRQALINEIQHGSNRPEIYDGAQEADWIMECINKAPVAYDVDKVIEKVDKISVNRGEYSEIVNCNLEAYGHCSSSCYECILNCVIDILKGRRSR